MYHVQRNNSTLELRKLDLEGLGFTIGLWKFFFFIILLMNYKQRRVQNYYRILD